MYMNLYFSLVGGCLGRINNDLNIDAGISTYSQLRNIIWNIGPFLLISSSNSFEAVLVVHIRPQR